MEDKGNPVELLVMCVVMIVLALAGIAGSFSRDLFGNLDGLLILFVSLMILLVFSLLLVFQLKQQGWFGKHDGGPDGAPATPAK